MTVPNPFSGDFPIQDFIDLNGSISPGKAMVAGAGSPRTWDVRKGYGLSGATVVFTGDGVAKFDVKIVLWLPEHFADWVSFARKVLKRPPKGQRPSALKIKHPLLNLPPLEIVDVVVEDVTQFDVDDYGEWFCTIKFLQYRKPLPMLAKPNGAIPPVGGVTVPTAQTAAEKALQAAQIEHDAVAAQLAGAP